MPEDRPMTQSEVELARTIFKDAIDYSKVRIANKSWMPFQPKRTLMAPMGTIHFNPKGGLYKEDFGKASVYAQSDIIHELVHVWQWQKGIFLPLRRHPFCRYDYAIKPGQPFEKYGFEQQGEIARHAFLLSRGRPVTGAPPIEVFRSILPF